MARAIAHCTCRVCGASFERKKTLYNCREAESWKEWAEDHIDMCPECERKASDIARAAALEDLREKYGLVPLVGSEKQIAWANSIRLRVIRSAIKSVDRSLDISKRELDAGKITEAVHAERVAQNDKYIRYICTSEASASWWIDQNNRFDSDIIRAIMVRMHDEETSCKQDTQPDTDDACSKDDQDESKDEQYIAGPDEPEKDGVVVIICEENNVKFKYVRDSDFINMMHAHACLWSDRVWNKYVNEMTPSADDLAAGIGADLINNGFVVRFPSQSILDKAISGDYDVEHTRWVFDMKSGQYAGWFGIKWAGRNKYMYKDARLIKGSKYCSPYVVAPADRWKEVLDFAYAYNFRITDGANNIVEDQKTILSRRVTTKPIKPENIKPKLEQSEAILEDLRDE